MSDDAASLGSASTRSSASSRSSRSRSPGVEPPAAPITAADFEAAWQSATLPQLLRFHRDRVLRNIQTLERLQVEAQADLRRIRDARRAKMGVRGES